MTNFKRIRTLTLKVLCFILVFALIAPEMVTAQAAETQTQVSEISLSKKKATLYEGKTLKLSVKGSDSKVKWSSKDTSIATVNAKGVVTAVAKGTVKIKAKVDGKTLTCTVTVKKVGLSASKLTVGCKKTKTLKLNGTRIASVKSSDTSIVKISKKGVVRGVNPGTAKVTVKGKNGKKYTCKITVVPALSSKKVTLTKGSKTSIVLYGENIKSVKSGKKSIVKASKANKNTVELAAKKVGVSKITVTGASGKQYKCTVTVVLNEEEESKETIGILKNHTAKLLVEDAKEEYKWGVTDGSIASVSETGLVKGLKYGQTIVYAEFESGERINWTIIVENPAISVKKIKLAPKGTYLLTVKNTIQKVTWSVADDRIITISEDGLVTAVSIGSSQVYAEIDGERVGSCLVEVAEPVIMENYTPDTRPLVVFETNGGKRMNSVRVNPGTEIRTLSKPVYETVNGVRQTFLGWYYDEELTEAAENDDRITENCTLYAATVEMQDQTPEDECNVAAADDVPTTFTITVKSSNASLTASDVLAKLDVTNVSHAGAEDGAPVTQKANNIAVTGRNGIYTISGKHYAMQTAMDGFAAGESYCIELTDDCLTFDGFNANVREYNITVHMDDVNNLALADDVIPLKSSQATGLYRFVDTGDPNNDYYAAVEFLDGNLVYFEDNDRKIAEELNGYFTYSGMDSDKFKPGVKVALYDLMTPEEALANPAAFEADENSHIAYLTITRVDGNRFYFAQPEIDDILKKPEILPIAAGNDLNLDGLDDTVELFVSVFDWSDNKYATLGLDSNTTVDEGDFITFYSGTYGSNGMAQVGSFMKVVSIEKGRKAANYYGDQEEYYTIRFTEASQGDVLASGDTHYSMSADLYNSLGTASQTSLKSQIRQQFLDSGYAEQAAMYTAKAALATDRFTDLTGLARIDDYTLTFKNGLEDNEQVELMSLYSKYKEKIDNVREKSDNIKDMLGMGDDDNDDDSDVEVELTELNPSIGTAQKLGSGLRVSLDIGVEIEIDVPKYEGSDDDDDDNSDDDDDDDDEEENKLKIELTTSLVQEVQVELGFSAKVEWGSVGFIPYPEDIVLIPTITNGSYTNLEFNAKMYTSGGDDDEDTDDEASGEFFDITNELSSLLDSDDGVEEDNPEDIATWLGDKYSDMLDTNHSPVQLVDVEMFDLTYELVPGIISFELKGDFVVTADVVVSLGLEFEYITSKKHVYSISLIGHSIDSETIDLIKPELDFKFYVMGSLEIRAGIELEFSLNLVEGYLGQVSLTVGTGAYTIMRGFFYYHYHWMEGAGSTTKYAGAFYIEIGVYFEVGLGASVGKEIEAGDVKIDAQLYKTEVPLYENKWPLFTYGTNEAPIDFARAEEDYSDIEMHQYTKTFVVPDSYYDVMTLSLDSGDLNAVNYNNRTPNGSSDTYYGVKLSDTRHFEYEPVNHTISVVNIGDEEDQDPLQECSCTVTFYWKNGSVPLSTACMTRTFNVLWDNYKDGYSIVPFSQGGSYVAPVIGEKGSPVAAPADPTRLGYLFDGWYTNPECTSGREYTYPAEMPDADVNIYAKWTASNDIPYTVNVYTEIPEYVYDETKNAYVLNSKYMPGYYNLKSSTTYKAGTTGADKTVTGDPIEGYATPDSITYKIQADGSTVYNLYYDEKEYTVSFNDPSNENKNQSFSVHKGSEIIPPVFSRLGYTQTGWKNAGTGDVTSMDTLKSDNRGILGVVDGTVQNYSFEPVWAPNTDTPYRIEYYVRQPNGQCAARAVEYGYGTTGAEIDIAEDIRYASRTLDVIQDDGTLAARTGSPDTLFAVYDETDQNIRRVSFDKATDGVDNEFNSGKATIAADGKLVIKLFYERDKFNVTVSKTDGPENAADFGTREVYYNGKLVLDEAQYPGYHTDGWKEVDHASDTAELTKRVVITQEGKSYQLQGWTANSYKVKYKNCNVGDSTQSMEQDCTYDSVASYMSPGDSGEYKFDGWYNAATGVTVQPGATFKNLTTVNGGEVVLTGIWRPANKYYVTYNYNGGALRAGDSNPSYYMNDSDTASRVLSVPVKSGCDFTGWFIGDTPVAELRETVSTVTPGDITLMAGWDAHVEPVDGEEPEKVTVILDYNGYYPNARYEVEYGTSYAEFLDSNSIYSSFNSSVDADNDGRNDVFELTGWYETRNGVTPINRNDEITGYTVLFSRWKGGTGPIYYEGEGDTNGNPTSYRFGEGATIDKYPTRAGYTFTGWTDGETTTEPVMTYVIGKNSTKAVTLTANWKKSTWDISLYGANGIYQKLKDIEVGATIPAPMEPVNPGYSVKDWVDRNDATVYEAFPTTMPDKSLELQARFEKATYTITFDSMGGSAVDSMTFTIEDMPSLWGTAQIPERDGYDFDGWYMSQGLEESKRIDMFRPIESSFTLYAKWKHHTYTVVFFDGMEEITSITPITEYFDVAFTLPSYTFEDTSVVGGWTDAVQAASGSGIIYKPGAKVMKLASGNGETINLYAIKEMPGYTITYQLNNGGPTDGNTNPENFIKSNRKITLEDPKANEGYYFDGWYDESGNRVTEIDCSVEGNRTLTAHWIHAGTFSLTKVSSSGDLEAGTGVTTYRITRTIPAGAHADADTHYVYYRTENGTLIGGTTDSNAVNFKHVGGPEVFAIFKGTEKPELSVKVNGETVYGTVDANGNASIEFKVEKERKYATYTADMTDGGVMAQEFSVSNTVERYYRVLLYRVQSAEGNYEASLDNTHSSVDRTMSFDNNHFIFNYAGSVNSPLLYASTEKSLAGEKEFGTWASEDSDYFRWNSGDIISRTPEQIIYMRQTGGKVQISFNFKAEVTDSTEAPTSDEQYIKYYFRLAGNTIGSGTADPEEEGDSEWCTYDDSIRDIRDLYGKDYTVGVTVCDKGFMKWETTLKDFKGKANFTNVNVPLQVGIAPAAFSRYLKGDKVRFSVVYNEVIGSASDITVDEAILDQYLPVKEISLVGGAGTNVLVFEGTAKRDFEYATWSGTGTNEKLMYICPVNGGTITDPSGNSGNASARLLEDGKKLKDLGEYVYTIH